SLDRLPRVANVAAAEFSRITLSIVGGLIVLLAMVALSARFRDLYSSITDLVGFWPPTFQPLAPAPYTPKVVAALRDRIDDLRRDGYVVIVGHSQGSVLSYAAIE